MTSNNSTEDTVGMQTDMENASEICVPGLEESIMLLKEIALHGVALDGLLVWADTQRRTVAEDIWKNAALKHFSKEEITNAKNILWEVAKDDLLGRNVSRKGESKSASELDDICSALKILSEKQAMPIFVGTSKMVMQSPPLTAESSNLSLCSMSIKLNTLEETLEKFTKKISDVSTKNHDRLISKSDVGYKKMDEIAKQINDIRQENLARGYEQLPVQSLDMNNHASQRIPTNNFPSGSNVRTNTHTAYNYTPWTTVGPGRNLWEPTTKNPLHRLNEDARSDTDVCVVVKGVADDVSKDHIVQFLISNGVNAKECNLLTTYEHARYLSYKITVAARDQEKVKDLSIWPQNISIEPYKAKKGRNSVRFQTSNRKNENPSNDNPGITGILKRSDSYGVRNGRGFENFTVELSNDKVWLRRPNKSA